MAFDPVTYAAAKHGAKSYTDTKFDSLAGGFDYKGSVATMADLPTDASVGDEYTVGDLGSFVWDGTAWKVAGGKGGKGDKGDEGDPGAKGDPGKDGAHIVEVSETGTATDSVKYITIDGEEHKIAGDSYTPGTGILISAEKEISVNTEVIADVDYVDANISDTMAYVMQEDAAERAARIGGDELLAEDITQAIETSMGYTDEETTRATTTETELSTEISNLKTIGRFCAIWDASTGAPTSEPLVTPYNYKTGDYFRIGVAGYKVPTGSTYVPGAYDTVTEETGIGDVWYYDGTNWVKQASSGGGTVQDVTVAGTSVLSGGIAVIPTASLSTSGVVKPDSLIGTRMETGCLGVVNAEDSNIAAKKAYRASGYGVISTANIDKAVMEGLGNNSLTWSTAYKTSARTTIGAGEPVEIEVW